VAFNRETALRSAEKALQQGKVDKAIAEYAVIVKHQPRDFNSRNTLGDLYFRAGQVDKAAAQYTKIAEHYLEEGFFPKASALFKKILKIRPDDEQAALRLAEIAGKQGLLADARTKMNAIAAKRRTRGDITGADDVLISLADLDPTDVAGGLQAVRILAGRGQSADAAARLRDLAGDLIGKQQTNEALEVLREAVKLVPSDPGLRQQLVGLLHDLGREDEALTYFSREAAGSDPAMLLLVAKAELQTGKFAAAREDIRRALTDETAAADVMTFMREIAAEQPDAAFIAAEALAEFALRERRVEEAIEAMSTFLEGAPAHVGGALRFVEMCLEEDLDDVLPNAQAILVDTYIAAGQPDAGRQIAEEMAAAYPDDAQARQRLVHAYKACGVEDPAAQADAFLASDAANGPSAENTAADPLALEEADTPVPDFDVYVYGQPSPPLDPAEPSPAASTAAVDIKATPEETEVDLTATLDALDRLDAEAAVSETSAAPTDEVFNVFRQHQEENHLLAEKAYEEAEFARAQGQVDDALRLYGEAWKSSQFRFRAASSLGRLLRDEGRLVEAVEWLESASNVSAPDAEAGFALLYDLGDTLEQLGETMRALAVFMELQAEAGDYRGIAARIERLTRTETRG
jgi:tetratricopeptide (TPR) repeat protein